MHRAPVRGWSKQPRASSRPEQATPATRLDPAIVAALQAGRALIVPDAHRAAALRLAWARLQRAAGRTVWPSPEVLTWETWLTRQWRAAVLRGATPALQLLSSSQERALWQEVLQDLPAQMPLAAHAGGLFRAAGRASQGLLALSRSAFSEEEQLLVQALTGLRQRCAARGLMPLRLATPEELRFLRDVPPPAISGAARLTPLQQALQQQCWHDAALLLAEPAAAASTPALWHYPSLEAELAGCAQWCLQRLRDDAGARLLVITACAEPVAAVQGELLWRQLAGARGDSGLRNRLLAVEGGIPLQQLGLISDALLALDCLAPELDTQQLLALLRSPYLQFGSQQELWSLQGRFEKWALARWPVPALRDALAGVAQCEPAAARLLAWFDLLRNTGQAPRSTGAWAGHFSAALAAAGFSRQPGLDSREQQRLQRWNELLDEFAALDAVVAPLPAMPAVERLRQLAAEARHQAASGDAAITFSSSLADPVVDYDGIWVLGLTESRWPAPPRPDPYVALSEQRAQHWPEAGVPQRRGQALWALQRWQRRTPQLVLSYPEREGDLHHRPTALPGVPPAGWSRGAMGGVSVPSGHAATATDQQFPPLPAAAAQGLPGGVERLRNQRDCPFRAQARWRLHAVPPEPLSDGLTPAVRGTLLHLLLQAVWAELGDQRQLLALTAESERALLERNWSAVVEGDAIPASRWWPAGLRARERDRTFEVVAEVLQLERARAPFTVQARELKLQWPATGPALNLRIDRMDLTAEGTRVLIDYKSGAAGRMRLHEGELEPLQLALYVAALAARGETVGAAALFGLKPGEVGASGISAVPVSPLPGLKPVDDWASAAARWNSELLELLASHLGGSGTLALDHAACRHCHLPALCRRGALEDLEEGDE